MMVSRVRCWYDKWCIGATRMEVFVLLYQPPRLTDLRQSFLFSDLRLLIGLVQGWACSINGSNVEFLNICWGINSRKYPGIRILKWKKSMLVPIFTWYNERTPPPFDRWEKYVWSLHLACHYFSLGYHCFRPALFIPPLFYNQSSLPLVLHLNVSSSLLLELFSLILSFVCSEDCFVPHHPQDKE